MGTCKSASRPNCRTRLPLIKYQLEEMNYGGQLDLYNKKRHVLRPEALSADAKIIGWDKTARAIVIENCIYEYDNFRKALSN